MNQNSFLKIVLLFFFSTTNFVAQNKSVDLKTIWENTKNADSTRFNAINKFYLDNSFEQPDSILKTTNYHYNLAKEKRALIEMTYSLSQKYRAYYKKGDIKKAMQALEENYILTKKLNDNKALTIIYSNMGNIYGEQGKYQEAVRYFNKTLKYFQGKKIEKSEAAVLNNLGIIYFYMCNNDLALKHYKRSLLLYKKNKLEARAGTVQLNIGLVYFKQKKNKEAIKQAEGAIKTLLPFNDRYSLADCYFLLAQSYKELNYIDKAKLFLGKSIEIDDEFGNNSRIIERQSFKAFLNFDTDITLATKQAEEVLKLVNEDTENELKVGIYNLLYKCYKKQNKIELSLVMHEKYAKYNDSLATENYNLAVMEEAIQQEYKEKLNVNNSKNRKKTYGIIAFCTLLISLVLIYYRKTVLYNRKKRDELLQEIEKLKNNDTTNLVVSSNEFELIREKIEKAINRKLNDTDWTVLNVLLEDPVITNIEIAEKVFMSVDGIGSSLRRMYEYFNIKESKYKKISLLLEAIKISNNSNKIA
jgi:tetratricopeptide (TPR) repeat protein